MSAEGSPPVLPAPTLFVSYASQDREAARLLRDAVSAHGIDVWYDEDGLTGGDAWDQKIRRRIRECDYFMPVISRATQARKEGYFRREWRQAAERTLDMADDVLFLVPVNISEIDEATARVPERFHQVHWTRCPEGKPNADLNELCQRIRSGEDTVPAKIIPATNRRRAVPAKPSPAMEEPEKKKGKNLPPYPAQPHRKTDEPAWLHVFNLLVWVVQCVYRAYQGFPRILRWAVIIWAVFFLFSRCQAPEISIDGAGDESEEGINPLAELTSTDGSDNLSGFGRFLGAMADVAQAGRTFAIVPITTNGESESTIAFSDAVLKGLIAKLESAHRDHVSFSPVPLGVAPTPKDLFTRIGRTEAQFLFTGWVTSTDETEQRQLHLVLQPADRNLEAWQDSFLIVGNDPANVTAVVWEKIEDFQIFANTSPATP